MSDTAPVLHTSTHHAQPEGYFARTRRPLPMLGVLLPLILCVELGFALSPEGSASRVLARLQLQHILDFFTLAPIVVVHGLGVMVVLVLLCWHVLDGSPWRLRVLDLPIMLFEGCLASVPLLVLGAAILTREATPLAAVSGDVPSGFEPLLVACAAALSEEFIFRMGGIALVHWLLVDVLKRKTATGTSIAVVVTAVAFMFYHDPWSLSPQAATFVLVAGLYLGGLYAQRGFAPAVLAHAAYDLVALG
jgi:membrane protease YdiL (CAAX protease family)